MHDVSCLGRPLYVPRRTIDNIDAVYIIYEHIYVARYGELGVIIDRDVPVEVLSAKLHISL